MSWANLGILGVGGLLMSVPIILHFLMQPKPIEIEFPALRFLKQRQKTTRSRMRLKHFLLLLMRCLLIGLVALALAGPSVASNLYGKWLSLGGIGFSGLIVGGILALSYFRAKKNWPLIGVLGVLFIGHLIYGGVAAVKLLGSESGQLLGDDQDPVAALIVIDSSPRMELQFENETRFAKAKEMATWLIKQLPGDSQVCVVTNDGDRPFFSVDVAAADRRVDKLKINYRGARLPAALGDGLKVLLEAQQERKEIYVISDLTKESWLGDKTTALTARLQKEKEISLFLFDVGVEDPNNFSLSPIRLASSSEITPSGILSLEVDAQRIGPADQRAVSLKLEKLDPSRPIFRDGKTEFTDKYYQPQTISKDIRENSAAKVRFEIAKKLEVGTYHGTIELEAEDGLKVDNRRYFTFRVHEARNVLLVHPANVNPTVLVGILAPQAFVDDGTAPFKCEVIEQADLGNVEDLTDFDAIFLLDPKPIQDDTWKRLETFVSIGRGLGIFLGPNASTDGIADPAFTTEVAQRVIGGELDQQFFSETGDLYLSPKELSHPIFTGVRSNPTNVLWNRAPIIKHWGIEPDSANKKFPTQTLLSYGNREPAIIERVIGLGSVLTMTTPITEYASVEGRDSWNLLFGFDPVPAFLLITSMTDHLVQTDSSSLNVEIGAAPVFKNDLQFNPETYQVYTPDIEKAPAALNSVEGRIRYRFNNAPGHYRFRGIFDDQVMLRGFSSNLPAAATDLTRVKPEDIDSVLGADRYKLSRDKNEIQRQQGTTRRGQEFYPLVVLMMLVILGVEYLMSNRFYS